MRTCRECALGSLTLFGLASCGAGVVGVAASSGSSGGGSTPALDSFLVESPKVSPSVLKIDASQPVRVGLFYGIGATEEALTKLVGIAGNEVDLPAGEVSLTWDFAAELPGGSRFAEDVRLIVKRGGSVIAGGELTLDFGNDAPEVLSIDQIQVDPGVPPDPGEASGTTGIELTVADSSDDVVSVKVEFDVQGDVPDAGWQLARPGLVEPGLPTPEFGIAGVQASRGGTRLSFFWDTDAVTDLRDLERDALLRFTPTDGFLPGAPFSSVSFRVDNNDEPILQLLTELFVTGTDERRGIPVPYRVTDEEGDLVEVVFQWRRPEDPFPELPTDGAQLDAILADPVLRREHHICTAYPRQARGGIVPVDETTVRLPELAQEESWALAWELEGRTLELLRRSSIPEPISPTWPVNPLLAPVAALPFGDGLTAIVVDGVGSARVREIELATGRVVREIANLGPGTPTAAVLERGEAAVLVATDLGGLWRLERAELATGVVTELFVSDGASPPPPVRGLASLGRNAALVTVGSTLSTVDFRDPLAPRLVTLFDGLATPWGVVLDPLQEGRVYVAERDAPREGGGLGRILAVDLDTHGKVAVAVKQGPVAFEHPEALGLARSGARILAVTNPPGEKQVVGLDLGGRLGNVPFALGSPILGEAASVAGGADGLVVVVRPDAGELLVGGGLEQRRAIVGQVLPPGMHASVDAPFDPVPSSGQSWRIALASRRPARPDGVEHAFAWHADADLPSGGSAVLRALARDSEAGLVVEGRVAKRTRTSLEVAPTSVTNGSVNDVASADIDGDGDLDLAFAIFQSEQLSVFFQGALQSTGRMSFNAVFLSNAATTLNPTAVEAADLDGDGDIDLVSSNGRQLTGGTLDVYFQSAPRSFDPVPLVLASPDMLFPECVRAADLDQDGDLDLVSANRNSMNLTIFEQTPPREFAAPTALELIGSSAVQCVAPADLDGDGDFDLATPGGLFFQSTPLVFDPPMALDGSAPVGAADLDADGDLDLFAGTRLFLQGAPGVFGSPVSVIGAVNDAADVDGDGDLDLLTSSGILFQSVTGAFGPDPLVVSNSTAADMNADGRLDLLSGGAIYPQSLPGGFDGTTSPIEVGGSLVTAADLDGDGDLDLASTRAVRFQSAPGVFDGDPVTIDPSFQTTLETAADFDGDGDMDLASTDSFNDDLRVFFQGEQGSFGPVPLVLDVPGGPDSGSNRGSNPTFIVTADLDGDEDLDMASANFGSDDLTIFFQANPGAFDAPFALPVPGGGETSSSFSPGSNPWGIAAADLDTDGDLDLASANNHPPPRPTPNPSDVDVTVFFQQERGSFDPMPMGLNLPGTDDLAIGTESITAADLDGDGDTDLATANAGTTFGDGLESRTVFFQVAPGAFDPVPLVLSTPFPRTEPIAIASSDLDGDGDIDLVSSNFSSGISRDLTVYFQIGPGIFDPAPLRLSPSPGLLFIGAVLARDIDGDGDVDLAGAENIFWGGR